MTDLSTTSPARGLGATFIALGVATIALLSMHPGGGGGDFAAVLRDETSHRLQDAVVHGGMVGILAADLVALALLALRLGSGRAVVVCAFILTAMGVGALSGALVLDGLVTPDVASRYLSAPPAAMASGRALFVLLGSAIRFLMSIGLAFQGAAALGWGVALWRGKRRVAGGLALVVGVGLLAGLAATITELNAYVLMGGFMGQALWLAVLGAGLIRKPV